MADTTSSADSSFSTDFDPGPDAQGQAALLLIESLIHSLLDNGALTKLQALEALDSAVEVKRENAADAKEPVRTLRKSLSLLDNMRHSIEAYSERHDPGAGAGRQPRQGGAAAG